MNLDELVTAATVGVGARPVAVTELPAPAAELAALLADDPATAVLDAVAVLDAARRASGFVPVAATLPAAAPDETTAAVPVEVAHAILDVAANDRSFGLDLLGLVRGRHMPSHVLPALLGLATRDDAFRLPVARVLGERGRWLAAQHPEWHRVLGAGVAPVDVADGSVWTHGRADERRAWFAAKRRLDPAAARALLIASWPSETGDDRVDLLARLQLGLERDDEPFLEQALDDRRAAVREQAAALLASLPGSAFRERAIARARNVIRIERRALRRHLVTMLPPEPDAGALRDGVPARSGDRSVGDGAWRLIEIVAAVPLDAWPSLLDVDVTTLVGLSDERWTGELQTGWRRAALRQRNAEWARALLTRPVPPLRAAPGDAVLHRVLPPAERSAIVVDAVRAGRLDIDVDLVPAPWPAELVDAVLRSTALRVTANEPTADTTLITALGRRAPLDPDRRPVLQELAERARSRPDRHHFAATWARALDNAARALDIRQRIHRALENA